LLEKIPTGIYTKFISRLKTRNEPYQIGKAIMPRIAAGPDGNGAYRGLVKKPILRKKRSIGVLKTYSR